MAALVVRITNSSPVAHWGKVGGRRVDLGLLDETAASYKPQNSRTDDADLAEGGH